MVPCGLAYATPHAARRWQDGHTVTPRATWTPKGTEHGSVGVHYFFLPFSLVGECIFTFVAIYVVLRGCASRRRGYAADALPIRLTTKTLR